jgi:hypothetical protein
MKKDLVRVGGGVKALDKGSRARAILGTNRERRRILLGG